MTDPFGTADLRRTVLAAWAASPARFREDANTEEDHARGYYRDRVIVELAQNAADAAVTAGIAGHLSFVLTSNDDGDGAVLYAHNTGAPLTAAGVQALATMRASAKSSSKARGPAPTTATAGPSETELPAPTAVDPKLVGRFGVGFAAVRAVSDSITISSRTAPAAPDAAAQQSLAARSPEATQTRDGVLFDLARTRQELIATADTELAQEVATRGDDLPILRLPIPVAVPIAAPEFTTTVALGLRDAAAVAAVRAQLDAVDELLLLALPGLGRISVTTPRAADVSSSADEATAQYRTVEVTTGDWLTVHRSGQLPQSVLAGRPVEERDRTGWSLTWALRTDAARRPAGGEVVHAPTATDERCSLPAVLIATFPLDPSRRHIAPGPVTEEILTQAAAAYVELVQQVAQSGGTALDLVPTGLAAGSLDATMHEQIRAELPNVALLPSAAPPSAAVPSAAPGLGLVLLRPRDAFALQGAGATERNLVAVLAEQLPELIWLPAQQQTAARALGVPTRSLSDVIDDLAETTPRLRDVLLQHIDVPGLIDALVDLPVRLSDGRMVRGVRGVIISDDIGTQSDAHTSTHHERHAGAHTDASADLGAFERWGLRVADPQQTHPLWGRLGAASAAPLALLESAPVQQAIVQLSDLVETTAFRSELDPDDDSALTAVLHLVQRAVSDDGALPAQLSASLAGLPLESVDGELEAARDLTVPGSVADDLFDGLLPVAGAELHDWGEPTLAALGVRVSITVQTLNEVVADAGLTTDDHSLPDQWPDYVEFLAEQLGEGAYIGEVQVIADLDAVGDEQWGRFLTLVAGAAQTRSALLTTVRGQISYAAWWLRAQFDAPFARAGLGSLYLPPAPAELAGVPLEDDDLWAALGAVGGLTHLAAADWDLIFEQLPDVGTPQGLDSALEFWAALVTVAGQQPEQLPEAPGRIVARMGAQAVVCAADDVVVSAEPMWTQVPALPDGATGIVPAPNAQAATLVADFLDVPVLEAADTQAHVVGEGAQQQDVPPALVQFLKRASAAGAETPQRTQQVSTTWLQHPAPFAIRVNSEEETEVFWWVTAPDVCHAVTMEGLACALAQQHNQWHNRLLIAALLRNPDAAEALTADTAWD